MHLGASGEMANRTLHATVLQEGGLDQIGVTLLSTDSNMSFNSVIEAPVHRPGKYEPLNLVRVHYEEVKRAFSTVMTNLFVVHFVKTANRGSS